MLKDRHLSVREHPTAKELRTRDVGTLSSCGAYTEWQPTVVFHSLNPLLIISHLSIDVNNAFSNLRSKLNLQHCLLFIEEAAE